MSANDITLINKEVINMKTLFKNKTALTAVLLSTLAGTAFAHTGTHANSNGETQVLNTEQTQYFLDTVKEEVAMQGYNINFGSQLPKVTIPSFGDVQEGDLALQLEQEAEEKINLEGIDAVDAEFEKLMEAEFTYLEGIDTNKNLPLTNELRQKLITGLIQSLNEDGITVDFGANQPTIERAK